MITIHFIIFPDGGVNVAYVRIEIPNMDKRRHHDVLATVYFLGNKEEIYILKTRDSEYLSILIEAQYDVTLTLQDKGILSSAVNLIRKSTKNA